MQFPIRASNPPTNCSSLFMSTKTIEIWNGRQYAREQRWAKDKQTKVKAKRSTIIVVAATGRNSKKRRSLVDFSCCGVCKSVRFQVLTSQVLSPFPIFSSRLPVLSIHSVLRENPSFKQMLLKQQLNYSHILMLLPMLRYVGCFNVPLLHLFVLVVRPRRKLSIQ